MLKGKVVVVTGGASGIGSALCVAFARAGAQHIVVADLNVHAAQKVVDDFGSIAPSCKGHVMRCDVGVEMDVRRVIVTTEAKIGHIAVFCSNAGIPSNGGFEVTNDEWDRIWRVNVMQHVWVARHLFPLWMEGGRGGDLVITASAAGLLTQVGGLPYSVTKHAAVSVAEWLEISYSEHGVRTHCICPQAVQTGMVPEGLDAAAGLDGILPPERVADDVVTALNDGTFMILPHPNVRKYFQRKAADYDRWVNGMKRLHQTFGKLMMRSPNASAAKL